MNLAPRMRPVGLCGSIAATCPQGWTGEGRDQLMRGRDRESDRAVLGYVYLPACEKIINKVLLAA